MRAKGKQGRADDRRNPPGKTGHCALRAGRSIGIDEASRCQCGRGPDHRNRASARLPSLRGPGRLAMLNSATSGGRGASCRELRGGPERRYGCWRFTGVQLARRSSGLGLGAPGQALERRAHDHQALPGGRGDLRLRGAHAPRRGRELAQALGARHHRQGHLAAAQLLGRHDVEVVALRGVHRQRPAGVRHRRRHRQRVDRDVVAAHGIERVGREERQRLLARRRRRQEHHAVDGQRVAQPGEGRAGAEERHGQRGEDVDDAAEQQRRR